MPKPTTIHFEISERKVLLRIFDVLLVLSSLYLVSELFDLEYFNISEEHWVWSIVLCVYLLVFSTIFELYNLQKASNLQKTVKNIFAAVSLTVLLYLFTPFYTPKLPSNRLQILVFFGIITFTLFIWRLAYIKLISAPRFFKRILVVGDSFDIELIAEALQKSDPNYQVIGYVNTDINNDEQSEFKNLVQIDVNVIDDAIKQYHINEIVVASSYTEGVMLPLYNKLITLLEDGFPIREYTQVYEEVTHRIPVQHIDKDFYKFFPFSRSNQNKFYLFYHRLFDVLVSVLGILLSTILLPFILIGNLVANRGPLFYIQERIGKNGKPFKIMKLRTMVVDAEVSGAQWAKKNDTRTTPFGKFLRRSRIDEIPQFYNIILGHMSIIGPRPERPMFVKELSSIIPFYETRHVVKPGLTGWAQVNTSYGSSYADSLEKLQYDLYYIKHRSVYLDISIVLKTLSTIIFYRGQ
ncbi:sugar transferase [Croceibacter atlanticus]|jgi:exopolysaccharide biosynthesis polyprenyl glycosylphosphotransferase|uniref:Sugar transferase n=1 Tax=Croceibacter atlanticus (strain ATCC BAA-628 / JCM 21780 / CIP 108009 / IAM 15332 / KCTC 12090 / HTCC2559) TaxID=216432 RepID=A3UAK0_CROAH|nr:sugar transferase [Croceibacter atlanticus]EAP86836.1 sugar transferase [Croceibacter atlanticus HTCC2559]